MEKIKHYFRVINGATPKSGEDAYWGGNIVWITPADYNTSDKYIAESRRGITEAGLASCGTTLVPVGSIVVSNRAPIGLISIAGVELCTSQGCKCLVPYRKISSEYVYYYLSIQEKELNALGRGTTFLELSSADLAGYPISLPNDITQEFIVHYLNHKTAQIDQLIADKENLITLLREKRQTIISEAVTKGLDPTVPMRDSGIEWIGEIPAHWVTKKLKYLGNAIIGLTYSPEDIVDDATVGTLVLRSSNIQKGELVYSDNVYVNKIIPESLKTKCGDILICSRNGSRELIGKNAIIKPQDADNSFGAFMTIFRSEYNAFLYYVFNSTMLKYLAASFSTSTVNQLTTGNLNNIEVPLPSIEEQNIIINHLHTETEIIDTLMCDAQTQLAVLKEYRQAVISEAVTGKVKITEEGAS